MNRFFIEVLNDLAGAFPAAAPRFLLLGAGSTDLALRRDGRAGGRDAGDGPAEFDLVFTAAGWDEIERIVTVLDAAEFEATDREEILRHVNGSTLFLWPVGDAVAPGERIAWPGSGAEYSTAGLALALGRAEPAAVTDGLEMLLPPLEILLLVRIVFYLGRMSSRDLTGIVRCLAGGAGEDRMESARRLGERMRAAVPEEYHRIPRNFLNEIEAVHAPMIARVFRQRGDVEPAEGRRMEQLFALFEAFGSGFAAAE